MNKRTIIEVAVGGLAVAGLVTATAFAVNIAGERDEAKAQVSNLASERSDLLESLDQAERDGRYSVCIAIYLAVSQDYDLPEYLIQESALDYCEDESNWVDDLFEEPQAGGEA